MKKFASLIMAVLMLCALCVPASAATEDDDDTLTPLHYYGKVYQGTPVEPTYGDHNFFLIGQGVVRVLYGYKDYLYIVAYVGDDIVSLGWVDARCVHPMDEAAYLASLEDAEDLFHYADDEDGEEFFLLPLEYSGKFKVTIPKAVPYIKYGPTAKPTSAGSTLSEGNWRIVAAVAAAAVIAVAAIVITKKKKEKLS